MLLAINPPVCLIPEGHRSSWPDDRWRDLWKPLHMEVQRLLGVGWQRKRSKWDFSPMGRPSSREPLGGSPLGYCLNHSLPSLYSLSILAYWNHQPPPPITYHLCAYLNHSPVPPVSPVLPPGAKCLKQFVGQKRNVLRRLICGIWTNPRHGGVTHWQKSLALLEHTLYAPIAPLFGIVPSTRSQPLPEWPVW